MKLSLCLFAAMISGHLCLAQENPVPDDWKSAQSNQRGKEYPQVNSERRARFRIVAPQAQSVSVSLGKLELTKGDDGAWVGVTKPLDEGFHYYSLKIDGADVPDPNSMFFYGAGRWGSAIEIPASDKEFYALKNVPHGELRQVIYFSKSSDSNRRIFVYTPPGYDKDPNQRFPVLYLQHGAGEDETGWGSQGHTGLILDNLIAEGKAKPFIVVMENGGNIGGPGAPRPNTPPAATTPADAAAPNNAPAARSPGGRGFNFTAFERVLIDDLIPYIDASYRTTADQPHRGMAGLSMGGMQTRVIGLARLDTFSHIGVFSGGSIAPTDITDIDAFKQKVKLTFFSFGSREGGAGAARTNADALKQAGVNSHYYESPETAHEWQSWRRSLREFAPLLFNN